MAYSNDIVCKFGKILATDSRNMVGTNCDADAEVGIRTENNIYTLWWGHKIHHAVKYNLSFYSAFDSPLKWSTSLLLHIDPIYNILTAMVKSHFHTSISSA